MDIQKTLQSISTELLGVKLTDGNLLQLWANYVQNGVHTLDGFAAMLKQMPAYEAHVKKTLLDVADEFFSDPSDALAQAFWEAHVDSEHRMKPHEFLIQTEAFQRGFRKHLDSIFQIELGEPLEAPHFSFYYDRVKKTGTFDVLTINDDVIRRIHEQRSSPVPQATSGESQFANAVTVANANANAAVPVMNRAQLDDFEGVFQRPMFVQEYFKYVVETDPIPPFDLVFAQHTERFNRLREIFEAYTGKNISEYYYVNKYLFASDAADFFDNIVDEIVDSKEYKTGMSKNLTQKYLNMFDVNINEADLDYIFQIVKSKKLDIKSEELATLLTALKDETDSIVSRIFKVYMKVFERPPDITELNTYVNFYRIGSGDDVRLEKTLMTGTLEFHDSIKKRIRREYLTNYGKEILTSQLYDVLNRVLVLLDQLDMESLDATIMTLI